MYPNNLQSKHSTPGNDRDCSTEFDNVTLTQIEFNYEHISNDKQPSTKWMLLLVAKPHSMCSVRLSRPASCIHQSQKAERTITTITEEHHQHKLRRAPKRTGTFDFDTEEWCLPSIKYESWAGMKAIWYGRRSEWVRLMLRGEMSGWLNATKKVGESRKLHSWCFMLKWHSFLFFFFTKK